jgi:hypothetical protein
MESDSVKHVTVNFLVSQLNKSTPGVNVGTNVPDVPDVTDAATPGVGWC